jgi:hypothetical protein
MRTGRPIAALMVTGEEREPLEEWTRRPKTAQALDTTGRAEGLQFWFSNATFRRSRMPTTG